MKNQKYMKVGNLANSPSNRHNDALKYYKEGSKRIFLAIK